MLWLRHPGPALDAYLDGELDAVEAARVGRHLGRCPACRRQATVIRLIGRALRVMAG